MNIAFLFNADHPSMNGMYGYHILKLILKTNILQNTKRNMKVSLGDILTYSAASQSNTPTYDYLEQLNRMVYTPNSFNKLLQDKLEDTYNKATVYCWLFQNITIEIANLLHNELKNNIIYLGAMDVDYSNSYHLFFFKNSLIETYRVNKQVCSLFYSMGENEDPDRGKVNLFKEYEFDVNFEDSGARHTIFDNYFTIEHFKRVNDFRNIFLSIIEDDILDDVLLSLEELHPKIFNILASAARTFKRIDTEEDIAQCSISGRRILEGIANYLYPPSDINFKGRKVGKAEYKNRLWAYIEQTIEENELADKNMLNSLGQEIDKLIQLFNKGLHGNLSKQEIEIVFKNLIILIKDIIELSPESARKPYLAYEDEINKFHNDVMENYL